MKDHNKTLFNIKDVKAVMNTIIEKERFKKSVYAIFGYFNLINDQRFKDFMMMDIAQWINVCMFAEGETPIDEQSKFFDDLIRNQIMETYGKILYYSNNRGHVDIHVEPIKEHFQNCTDYLNEIMGVGMDGD